MSIHHTEEEQIESLKAWWIVAYPDTPHGRDIARIVGSAQQETLAAYPGTVM